LFVASAIERSDASVDHGSLATSLWQFSNLPRPVSELLIPEERYGHLAHNTMLPEDAPVLSVQNFRDALHRERDERDRGRYVFSHLIVPHFPYVLQGDCRWERGVETGPLRQARCAVELVIELVEELQNLGRFEGSTLVIHGDHGANFTRTDGTLQPVFGDFFSPEWSDARSRSLLLVKPAGRSSEHEMVVSDYPAMTTDIMPTVLDSVGVDPGAADGRTSLLAVPLPERIQRYYHFYEQDPSELPDGALHRYVISESALAPDRTIPVPDG
jgi:hypothetical protein